MQVFAKREEGCQSQKPGSAGFVANPYASGQAADLAPLVINGLVENANVSAPLAGHFPPGRFAEFIPMGMTTSFGDGSRATLKMLRQFANLPHVLCFGQLRLEARPRR